MRVEQREFEKLFDVLAAAVEKHLRRVRGALLKVKDNLEKAKEYENYKKAGDLILANLHRLRKGDEQVRVMDFYGQNEITLTLDPRLDPISNAQSYYKKYKKLKRGLKKLEARVAELEMELKYLQEIENNLKQAESMEELLALGDELIGEGYIKEVQGKRQVEKAKAGLAPREFTIDGYKVLVGKSGRGNDELIRRASRSDIWLHVRDMPGAHVIIKAGGRPDLVPKEVLYKASQLAAFYSKGRNSTKVLVSHTLVRYLRPLKGAKPGMVICEREEVMRVRPQNQKEKDD
jgi:predicted ribosome quality control (RQC) complex YloA/Tae2 family protein